MFMSETDQRRRESLEHDLAPVYEYLVDDSITDVLRNPDGTTWIERLGSPMEQVPVVIDDHQVEALIRTVASQVGRSISPQQPSLQAELDYPRLFRLQGLLPPVVRAPALAIRKPGLRVLTLADYQEQGILSFQDVGLIRQAVADKQNILIGGGTGTGKTTLANAVLAELIHTGDRLYVIEDTRELRCAAPNCVSVRVSGLAAEDRRSYTYRRAIQDALRLRPDRIIVGEVRNRAAEDLIEAWNTGHPGGLATIHANSPVGMLKRLCQLVRARDVLMRAFIAETVQFLIHIRRDREHPAGRRIALATIKGLSRTGFSVTPLNETTATKSEGGSPA
jgi:type IV secretion system protein TrbB